MTRVHIVTYRDLMIDFIATSLQLLSVITAHTVSDCLRLAPFLAGPRAPALPRWRRTNEEFLLTYWTALNDACLTNLSRLKSAGLNYLPGGQNISHHLLQSLCYSLFHPFPQNVCQSRGNAVISLRVFVASRRGNTSIYKCVFVATKCAFSVPLSTNGLFRHNIHFFA
jgi:hypothetical protein